MSEKQPSMEERYYVAKQMVLALETVLESVYCGLNTMDELSGECIDDDGDHGVDVVRSLNRVSDEVRKQLAYYRREIKEMEELQW
jgi:hypothetical protein